METRLSSNVADLSDEQRRTVETLIGHPLHRDQVLYWVVMSPGQEPTAANKVRARTGLQELFDQVDQHMAGNGTKPEQFESTVEEAVRNVRSQPLE